MRYIDQFNVYRIILVIVVAVVLPNTEILELVNNNHLVKDTYGGVLCASVLVRLHNIVSF